MAALNGEVTPHHLARTVRHMTQRLPTIAGVIGVLSFLPTGIWAMVAPESFADNIASFDPYNQHFVQDLGAFQIGLGAVLVLALLLPAAQALTVALLGTGIGTAAHTVSHVIGRDLGGKPSSDIPMFAVIAVLLIGVGVWQLRDAD